MEKIKDLEKKIKLINDEILDIKKQFDNSKLGKRLIELKKQKHVLNSMIFVYKKRGETIKDSK